MKVMSITPDPFFPSQYTEKSGLGMRDYTGSICTFVLPISMPLVLVHLYLKAPFKILVHMHSLIGTIDENSMGFCGGRHCR